MQPQGEPGGVFVKGSMHVSDEQSTNWIELDIKILLLTRTTIAEILFNEVKRG